MLLCVMHFTFPQVTSPGRQVVERLDGLDFAFGPASFQQANLQVFERVLQAKLQGDWGPGVPKRWEATVGWVCLFQTPPPKKPFKTI